MNANITAPLITTLMLFGVPTTASCQTADDYYNRGRSAIHHAGPPICRSPCLKAAIQDFTTAIKLKPDYAEAYFERGRAHSMHNTANGGVGRLEARDEIADYTKAIQLRPDYVDAYLFRGLARHLANQKKQAEEDFAKAIQIKPDDADAYYFRAFLLDHGNADALLADLSKALQFKENFTTSMVGTHAVSDVEQKLADLTARGNPTGQHFPIIIRAASSAKQATATLVLNVSWMFSGNERSNGGVFAPDASLSKITDTSGLAATVSAPVALSFSGLYKTPDDPFRVYFTAGAGDLQLWWSDAKPATSDNTALQLSPRWLAASKEVPATVEHPAGGISISSHTPSGEPLAFFIEFTAQQGIKSMGTQ